MLTFPISYCFFIIIVIWYDLFVFLYLVLIFKLEKIFAPCSLITFMRKLLICEIISQRQIESVILETLLKIEFLEKRNYFHFRIFLLVSFKFGLSVNNA